MILIGPGALALILLLAFRPLRRVVGWALFVIAALVLLEGVRIAHSQSISPRGPIVSCLLGGRVYRLPDFDCLRAQASEAVPPNRMIRCIVGAAIYTMSEADCRNMQSGVMHPIPWTPPVCDCPDCRPTADCPGDVPRR